MTDVMAALTLFADGDLPAREEVLEDFERRWRGDPLVMDKWFAAQAMSSRSDTLARVPVQSSPDGVTYSAIQR